MRTSPEHLFSLLTDRASAALGGIGIPETGDRVDAALAAGLTAGMPRNAYLAGRLALCRDWGVAVELERALMVEASRIAARERWKLDRPGRLRNLAGLAVMEIHDPLMRYMRKRGVQTDVARSMARQEWSGCKPDAWHRTWLRRYVAVLTLLDGWRSEAESWVNRMQRE